MRRLVFGIDFSGARDAGKRIWIATGIVHGGTLDVVDCRPASDLADAEERDPCLAALRRFILERTEGIFGLDFPFGVPVGTVEGERWEDTVETLCATCATADDLHRRCGELRRLTDVTAKAPMAPGNLRLRGQTYYGITKLLAPLVRGGDVACLPMQHRLRRRPWLVEVCPTATLRVLGLPHYRYKRAGAESRERRSAIVRGLTERGLVLRPEIAERAVHQTGGDVLDSLVAAYAAYRALACDFRCALRAEHLLEGHIFV